MFSPKFLNAIAVTCILVLPVSAGGQQARALSVDATVRHESVHTSGEFRSPQRGAAVDALVALRLGNAGGGAVIAGVNAGTPWAWASTTICLPASGGGCIPTYPAFLKIGALAGWENRRATLRAMGGPAYVNADGAATWGLQARLDGALPIAERLAMVGSVLGTMVPNFRGDAFQVYSIGLGVRLRQ